MSEYSPSINIIRHMMIEFLRLASVFGVLPCTNSRSNKSSISSGVILLIQLICQLFYVKYFCQNLKQFYDSGASEPIRVRITAVTALTNFFLDIFNVSAIIAFSLRVPKLTRAFLRVCAFNDKILKFSDKPWSRIRKYFFTLFTASVMIAKNLYMFITVNLPELNVKLSARYIYALIVFSEQYVSYMNLEIKSRLAFLNKKLISTSSLTKQDVELMQGAFRELTKCQRLLSTSVSKFMLFDLAQLLMLIIFRALNAVVSCVVAEAESAKSITWCTLNVMYLCDSVWRFSMITWSCGSLQAEVKLCLYILVCTSVEATKKLLLASAAKLK
jgi:hypothetical protein